MMMMMMYIYDLYQHGVNKYVKNSIYVCIYRRKCYQGYYEEGGDDDDEGYRDIYDLYQRDAHRCVESLIIHHHNLDLEWIIRVIKVLFSIIYESTQRGRERESVRERPVTRYISRFNKR